MTQKNKVLLLFPDGVGIRNYLYSDVVQHLKEHADLIIWFPLPEAAFEEVKTLHNLQFEFKQIKLEPEGIFTRVFRESATFGRLILNSTKTNNDTILTNWNYYPKTLKLKILNKVFMTLGFWASKSYDRILMLESKAQNHWSLSVINKYKNDLEALNLSSIFIAHQRVASLMPICIAAKELNIPVITAIYSWDNLPKARLAVQADKYIVWSDYMKEEMLLYYPEIPQSDVIVTGTPQFEFYSQSERIIPREEFAQKYGLNPNKKWICFSGDDIKTSPYDPDYLNDIAETVSKFDESEKPQLIFRRCPVDFSDRYDTTLQKYADIIVPINPLWNTPKSNGNWGAVFPMIDDINMQVNLAYHCELVVNLGSTMAHDFAMLDKPCFYCNYNPSKSEKWNVKTIYNFQHFRSMENLDAVGWLNSKEEVFDKIRYGLANPNKVGKDRKKWMQKIVKFPTDEASTEIAKLLLNNG